MNCRGNACLSLSLALGLVLLPSVAISQQKSIKEQLVGTWEVVSFSIQARDGKTIKPMGLHPKGVAVFTKEGRYFFINTRPGRPKFASKSRVTGTPEENKATVQGSIAYFGTYSADEAEKTYTVHIAASTYPNDEGGDSKREITLLTPNTLKYVNRAGSIGGTLQLEMKRVE